MDSLRSGLSQVARSTITTASGPSTHYARGIQLPTILFTNLPENNLAKRLSCHDEVVSVLTKPLGGEALVAAVRKAVGGA